MQDTTKIDESTETNRDVQELNRGEDIGATELYAEISYGEFPSGETGIGSNTQMRTDCDHVYVCSWSGEVSIALAPDASTPNEIGVDMTPSQALAMAASLYEAAYYARAGKNRDVVLQNGLAGDSR